MDFFFGGINGESQKSECPFAQEGIQRCPFLRNINEPTNFSFSKPMNFSMPVCTLSQSIIICCEIPIILILTQLFILLFIFRCGVQKVQFSKMVPILIWHLRFSMGTMEWYHSQEDLCALRICNLSLSQFSSIR